jgi:hypothetical protein
MTVAIIPTKRSSLERAAGFLEHHLAEIRQEAIQSDELDRKSAECLVMDATETAFAAGLLREMAEGFPHNRVRHAR